MSNAIERVRERLLRAAAALESAGVPYAVVGGHAVAAWVSRVDEAAVRNTRDVVILLRRGDLPAATAAFEKAGFVHRRVASLGQAGHLDVFLDGADGKARDGVHIVFAGEKTRDDAPDENPDPADSEAAAAFRLISLDALIRMKFSAWRDKDRVHLRDLRDVGLLDPGLADRLSPPLGSRLRVILESPED